jgi:phage-related protein
MTTKPVKRVTARLFVEPTSEPPSEPVREWLRKLPEEEKKTIGQDIMVVEMSWPNTKLVRPKLIDHLGNGIWEVRSNLKDRIARILFAVEGQVMLLLHGFIKKTQKTPKRDKDLAVERLKKARGIKS